ncbi:O-methyltransferase [Aeromonas jandaei]|uniref:O-methyltransferase n=1 Tax=Aeromonas jandaei TaxID=650 RepID=UPI003985AD4B
MNSGRAINYSMRVAKNIERKMIRDVLLRLYSFAHTSSYQYIGFGSKYFTDFILFHRYLHIKKMISIESDTGGRFKYEFNKPFSCVDIKFGGSSDILPTLDYSEKTIIWLDYDGVLNNLCLNDISLFSTKAVSGSVLLVSYNSRPYKNSELASELPDVDSGERQKTKFLSQIDSKYIPYGEDYKGLGRWDGHSRLLNRTINTCVSDALGIVNVALDENNKMCFSQILNFNYQDGVEMSTVGFIFYNESDKALLDSCKFDEIEYYRQGDDYFEIKVPNFTIKEAKCILEKMPMEQSGFRGTGLDRKVFTETDVKAFSKIYKYNPYYLDADII